MWAFRFTCIYFPFVYLQPSRFGESSSMPSEASLILVSRATSVVFIDMESISASISQIPGRHQWTLLLKAWSSRRRTLVVMMTSFRFKWRPTSEPIAVHGFGHWMGLGGGGGGLGLGNWGLSFQPVLITNLYWS